MRHVVQPGECVSSLSSAYRIHWRAIWEHPRNTQLREERKNPNLLLPGDELFIPEFDRFEADRATEAYHRFKLKADPTLVRLRFLFLGQPRADEPCRVELASGKVLQKRTDGDGLLQFAVEPDEPSCVVEIGTGSASERIAIALGQLDPPDTISGIQQRLSNLGFLSDPFVATVDETVHAAASTFLAAVGSSAAPGSAEFTKKLVEFHGG